MLKTVIAYVNPAVNGYRRTFLNYGVNEWLRQLGLDILQLFYELASHWIMDIELEIVFAVLASVFALKSLVLCLPNSVSMLKKYQG